MRRKRGREAAATAVCVFERRYQSCTATEEASRICQIIIGARSRFFVRGVTHLIEQSKI